MTNINIYNWDKLPLILDTKTVALIYGVSENTIKNWCYTNQLKGFKIGRKWHFNKDYIKQLSSCNM